MSDSQTRKPDPKMVTTLVDAGLIDDPAHTQFAELAGGVSSDIWKVTTPDRVFCVKQALPKLKVAADWFAPVERNEFEVSWYSVASQLVPGAAPAIFVQDKAAMLFAMEFLDPADHKLWKTQLHEGQVDGHGAAEAGRKLALIHKGTVNNQEVADLFPRKDIFHAIRLEPYLEATAANHPDLKDVLFGLSLRTAETQICMIHGDVSPKNILMGPEGPVFLDAECACMGDPAFDLAFCLNHFLLKCLWTPYSTAAFLDAYSQMTNAYLNEINWEQPKDFEARCASLLPGLFLARVDGKSPAEYVTEEHQKDQVRRVARDLLLNPRLQLNDVSEAWEKELGQ